MPWIWTVKTLSKLVCYVINLTSLIVDCLDSCCASHDQCYSSSSYQPEISNLDTIFLKYSWKMNQRNVIVCQDCRRGGDRKKCRKCNCDKKLALCLRGKPCPALLGGNRAAQCPPTPWWAGTARSQAERRSRKRSRWARVLRGWGRKSYTVWSGIK